MHTVQQRQRRLYHRPIAKVHHVQNDQSGVETVILRPSSRLDFAQHNWLTIGDKKENGEIFQGIYLVRPEILPPSHTASVEGVEPQPQG
jgi:hypothetical protein